MEKGLIITLPRYDTVTEYFSKFSEKIIDEATIKGLKIKKVSNEETNRDNFEKVLTKLKYTLVVLNGHGSEDSIAGHKDETILKSNENDFLLKNRITYSRACEAGEILGKTCVREGGCFIGYSKPFEFFGDPEKFHNLLQDNKARLFLEPSNLVPISLIKGNTAKDSHDKSRKQMLKNIKKVMRKKERESILMASSLWNNFQAQVLHGENELRV